MAASKAVSSVRQSRVRRSVRAASAPMMSPIRGAPERPHMARRTRSRRVKGGGGGGGGAGGGGRGGGAGVGEARRRRERSSVGRSALTRSSTAPTEGR